MISTQAIRNEMHAIDVEIRQLEDVLSQGDEEYEPARLPLALKRPRRRLLPRRDLRLQHEEDPFWTEQARRMIEAAACWFKEYPMGDKTLASVFTTIRASLDDLLAKRKAVYRRLRAAYRHNSEERKKGM